MVVQKVGEIISKKDFLLKKKWKSGQYSVKVKRNDNVVLVTSINCVGDIIIAGQGQGRIGLYDKEFDEISNSFVHRAVVWSIVVAEDKTCFSCSNDGSVAVFRIEDKKIKVLKKIKITSQMLWGLDVDIKRDILVVGTSGGEICVFCISTEERLYHCVAKELVGIYDVCLVGDICFASSYGPNSVVYSMSTNQYKLLTSGKASALCVLDGYVIAGSRSTKGEVDCWDLSTNTVIWTLLAGETVSDIKIFQNKIVAACVGYFRFWDRETRKHLYDIRFGAIVEGRLYSMLVQENFLICACGEQVVHVTLLEGRIRSNSLKAQKMKDWEEEGKGSKTL